MKIEGLTNTSKLPVMMQGQGRI